MKLIEKIDRCKKVIDELHPFEGHLLNEIKGCYRISSNAIEGNTRWLLTWRLHIQFPKLP